MLVCQAPIICKGKHCFDAEPLPCTHKLSGQLETLWAIVTHSSELQAHETSNYILLFTAQTILLKEAGLACALLLGMAYGIFISVKEVQRKGIHLSSVP